MRDAHGGEAAGRTIWLPYLVDVLGPFVAYVAVRAFGAGALWALTAAGLLSASITVVNSVRRRALDAVGALVLLELIASVVLLVVVHDARLLLVRPSFYTGIAAIYLLISAARGTPLSYAGSRPMAARGGPARLAAYERAWARSAEFRRMHRRGSAGFGVALALDSVLRVLIVYRAPVERAAWLSNVPHTVAIVLMIACSAMAGRRFGRLVDEEMGRDSERAARPTA
jgi:hypothetical protein